MTLPLATSLFAFVFGLNIGSFLNVVIWRLPRGGSLTYPTWSYCPRCEHRLGTLDLIPVLSFLALRAKCRYCGSRISWRYPAIEMLTGLLFLAVAWVFGFSWDTLFSCLFVACLIAVFFIDLEHFVIPDGVSVLAAIIGFAHNGVGIVLHQPHQWTRAFGIAVPSSLAGFIGYAAIIYGIGLASYVWLVGVTGKRIGFGKSAWNYLRDNVQDWAWITIYYLGALLPPLRRFAEPPEPLVGTTAEEIASDEDEGGMGGGDGKLAAAIGANLGLAFALQSALIALFVGVIAGIIVMLRQRRHLGERTHFPFGPAMVTGALIVLFFSVQLSSLESWYVRSFLPAPAAANGAPASIKSYSTTTPQK